MKLNKSLTLLTLVLLAGCSSHAQQAASNDTIRGYNSRHHNKGFNTDEAWQHAQAAHKRTGKVWKGYGQEFKLSRDGFAYLNDHLCAVDERTEEATVYSSGTYQIIAYHNGKTALMNNKVFVGYLKK